MPVSLHIGPKPPLKLWMASIDHKHGANTYIHLTKQGLYEALSEFCRQYWFDDGPGAEEPDGSPPEDDEQCVFEYFEDNDLEFIEVKEIEVAP